MNKLRVAVVGAGEFGQRHMRAIDAVARAELAAVVDIDPERAAEAAAAQYRARRCRTSRALAGRVDAAVVAVPTTAHVETPAALLEAGIDVLVEKPIAPDLAAARRLVGLRGVPRPHAAGRPPGALQPRRDGAR